jgi:ABC-type branched-subunit amino acid transport system substrate-binding protein
MGRTEIAGFQQKTYKTPQSDARKTAISQHEINHMGFVQGELVKGRILDNFGKNGSTKEKAPENRGLLQTWSKLRG